MFYTLVMEELSTRKKQILRWLVHTYIDTATPVSSSHLVRRYHMDCSPATVRNELASLEEMGYIEQPHTSAGRIPTEKGYRCFVDRLLKWDILSHKQKMGIRAAIDTAGGQVNRILEEASRLLGEISHELGVVLTPWVSWGIFDRIELIGLSVRKVLAVLHVRGRAVRTMVLEMESDLEQGELDQTAGLLNERLSGLDLQEIVRSIRERIPVYNTESRGLLRYLVFNADNLFDFSEPLEVHTCGTQNMLGKPEFSDREMMEKILTLIDNRRDLANLFLRKVNKTEVLIGHENRNESIKGFTVILNSYQRGKDRGTIGVIGPVRMHYDKALPLIDYMSKTISEYLS